MIKVNLLKNRGGSGVRPGTSTELSDIQFGDSFDTGGEEFSGGGDPKDILVKVLVMLVWTIGLYAYEWYNIGQLTDQYNSLVSESQNLTNEINQLKPQVEKAKVLQQENQALLKKVELVKDLGRLRLREIRAIDHLQNIIPDRVWFTEFSFSNSQFKVTGFSANDQELDKLLDGIRSNPTFQDVLLARAVEEKSKDGTIKSFVITSNLSGGP